MALRIITLNEIKANSRIDGNAEDTDLTLKGETAEQLILNLMDRSYDDIIVEYGSIPAPIKQACLAMADHLYHYRGPVSPTAIYIVPYTLDALIKPYIRY